MPIVFFAWVAQEMDLCSFLLAIPEDLLPDVLPCNRTLLVLMTNRALYACGPRLRLPIHVTPSKALARECNEWGRLSFERSCTVRFFLDRSVSMSVHFHIAHFTLENIRVDDATLLIQLFGLCPRMKVLHLHNNRIHDNQMHALLDAIPASVEVLKLTRQWIKVGDVECLGLAMQRLSCLKVLDLSENYLNSAGCSFIISNISSTGMESIALGFNHIKAGLHHRECDQLGFDRFALKHLDLKHNLINFHHINSIFKCVKMSATVIEELDLSHNDLRVSGVSILSGHLQQCIRLRRLNVAGNRMQNEGFYLLMCVISPPPHKSAGVRGGIALHSLDVSSNELTECSSGIFATCVSGNLNLQKTLCDISFSGNYLYDVGVKLIVEAMRPYPISKLCLAKTRLGECAGETLASAMQSWPNLRFLDVNTNQLRDTCLLLIATSMCNKSTKNRELYFRDNCTIHSGTIEHIYTMLSKNNIKHDPSLFQFVS